jgi:SAM-dependent methyltransferase
MNLTCPLCQSPESYLHDTLTGAELFKLWEAHGARLTWEALAPMLPTSVVELRCCAHCGFEFMDGRLAGGQLFYEEVSGGQGDYYPQDSSAYQRAAAFAKAHSLQRILDIGSGQGNFLDIVRQQGCATFGVELNRNGAEIGRSKGHTIFSKLSNELTLDECGGPFDLVTAFQVLEHVANPVSFLRDAARLVAPQGYIVIDVPLKGGVYRLAPYIPHQWPPHHVSRWRHADLRLLGEVCGLRIVRQTADHLTGAWIRHFARVGGLSSRVLGHTRVTLLENAVVAFGHFYSVLGLDHLPVPLGASAYAIFQRPSA